MKKQDVVKIRAWLAQVLGPTAHVESYSNTYAVQRFRQIYAFYGSSTVAKWKPPFPVELL